MQPTRRQAVLIRRALTFAGWLPIATVAGMALTDRLGANPIEEVTHITGEWGLRFLVLSLAVTPVRRLLGWSWIAPLRRTFGLFAFVYASLHFATYLGLDLFFEFALLGEDISERPYITVGFATFVLLVPLAATSTRGWMRRLGPNWKRLHGLVYIAAIGAIVHYAWLVKVDLTEPILYGAVVATLLVARAWRRQPIRGKSESPLAR